ncbi:ubinuclein-1 isoform X1 [Sesamum indicum]|uniref:Ubinuclein-1 isoform X1 n=1 Tax=Sesamum indicum TaxID=4182 RepID=A0A6I9UJR0_SESIN|nr:ubinuclein-1 isoform X1 [Sesamum indicum]
MAEGGGPNPGSGSRPMSSFESAGGRLRFTVELRPGETTIVSWKKLLREATSSKVSGSGPSASCPSSEAYQQPVSQPPLPPPTVASLKQPEENEAKDPQGQAGTNRLSTVIEKIERMYAGHGSSEEEDVPLDDVPDDDEYDTEDSFIDDTELDDYFQVDNSAIKHDGFFVNRGKLERMEPTISTNQQPKKRRRKDVTKGQVGMDDGHNPNKHVKIGNKGRKALSSNERNSMNQSHIVALPSVHRSDLLFEASPTDAAEVSLKKKTVDTQIMVDPLGLSSVDGIRQDKDADQQRTRVISSQNHNNHRKESSELQDDTLAQRPNDKSSHVSKSHSGKQLSNVDGLDQAIQRKEKGGLVERFDLNIPASRDSQITKVPLMPRKEGSHFRQKIAMLDKAIRELEKIVAESRPPSTEVQDPDNSSQAVKRRLPPEIKQKLAKVARLAQASYGKIPKDVISRLMSILGHLMQLRTLKRNLKVMANLGLSAKQEKDDRLQKIKQEIAEMVKQRIPYINSKVEHQTTNSDNFQEAGAQGKDTFRQKYSMDDVLENKICDLYDLYVEKLEEDLGPPVRRLYEELAALWPSGVMDTDGIKRAIYKSKDRRRALSGRRKDQEKMKKKMLAPKTENTTRGEAVSVNPALPVHEKLLAGSCDQALPLTSKPVLSAAVSPAARMPVPLANSQNVDKLKHERLKGSSSSNPVDAVSTDVLPKKKVKRKPNSEIVEAQYRLDKLEVSQVEERHRHHKHMAVPLPKSDLQPAAPSGSENLS